MVRARQPDRPGSIVEKLRKSRSRIAKEAPYQPQLMRMKPSSIQNDHNITISIPRPRIPKASAPRVQSTKPPSSASYRQILDPPVGGRAFTTTAARVSSSPSPFLELPSNRRRRGSASPPWANIAPMAPMTRAKARPTIICECEVAPLGYGDDFVRCESCNAFQHPACALPVTHETGISRYALCNPCKGIHLRSYLATKHDDRKHLAPKYDNDSYLATKYEDRKHTATSHEKLRELTILLEQDDETVDMLISTSLWKHYCLLPDEGNSETISSITKIEYKLGAAIPVYAAPEMWVARIRSGLLKMIYDAGEEAAGDYLVAGNRPGVSALTDLAGWRDLAMWLLYRGPYRGRTRELGVVGELLGLLGKGTLWEVK